MDKVLEIMNMWNGMMGLFCILLAYAIALGLEFLIQEIIYQKYFALRDRKIARIKYKEYRKLYPEKTRDELKRLIKEDLWPTSKNHVWLPNH